jgi:hypothetical protein
VVLLRRAQLGGLLEVADRLELGRGVLGAPRALEQPRAQAPRGVDVACGVERFRGARVVAEEIGLHGGRAAAEGHVALREVDVQRDRGVEILDLHAELGGRILRPDPDRVLAAAEIEIGHAVARIAQRRAVSRHRDARRRDRSAVVVHLHLDGALARAEVEVHLVERAAPHADLLLLEEVPDDLFAGGVE